MYFIFSYLFKHFFKSSVKKIEISFLCAALEYHSLKFQMLQMLEIIYNKAAESDPQFLKDYEKIKYSLDKNFTNFCNEYIINLQKTLGNKITYNNWDELIKYAELLYSQSSDKNNYGTRKRN